MRPRHGTMQTPPEQCKTKPHSFVLQETWAVRLQRWHRYFNIQAFETRHGSPMGHKFDSFIARDGLAVSIR